MYLRKLIPLLLLPLLLAGCGAEPICRFPVQGTLSQSSDAPVALTVAEAERNFFWTPAYLAQGLGYYAEEGLTVTFQEDAGHTDVPCLWLTDLGRVLRENEAGGDLRVVFSMTQRGSPELTAAWLAGEQPAGDPSRYEGFVAAFPQTMIDTDPDTVQRTVNALLRAAQWVQAEDEAALTEALLPFFSQEDVSLEELVRYGRGFLTETGQHTRAGFTASLEAEQSSGGITKAAEESNVYDESFLDTARESFNQSQLCRKHGAA